MIADPLLQLARRLWDKALIAAGACAALLPSSPLNNAYPARDSGVFLYIGWRILSGEVPYRDIWDHKPPGVYYIDALGLSITPDSAWGVWLLEWISISVAAFLGFQLARRFLGTLPAILGAFVWLLAFVFLIQGGNLTEEYALPLQFANLWLIGNLERSSLPRRSLFLVGALAGLAFFTKQTSVGIGCSIMFYLAASRLSSSRARELLPELLAIAAGGLSVCAVVVGYFGAQGALPQFWDAAFVYNVRYSSSGCDAFSCLISLPTLVAPLSRAWLLQISLAGYVVGIALLFRRRFVLRDLQPLLGTALIDLPLEVFLASFPGRNYPHYLISLLPILAFFSALAFWALFSGAPWRSASNPAKVAVAVAFTAVLLGSSVAPIANLVQAYRDDPPIERMVRHIQERTSPEDTVLVWGGEASLNFAARRRSPSPFVYLYPLYEPDYATEEMAEEFLDDVIRNRPRLIIETYSPPTPIFDLPIGDGAAGSALRYLKSQYKLQDVLGYWTIYEYVENDAPP